MPVWTLTEDRVLSKWVQVLSIRRTSCWRTSVMLEAVLSFIFTGSQAWLVAMSHTTVQALAMIEAIDALCQLPPVSAYERSNHSDNVSITKPKTLITMGYVIKGPMPFFHWSARKINSWYLDRFVPSVPGAPAVGPPHWQLPPSVAYKWGYLLHQWVTCPFLHCACSNHGGTTWRSRHWSFLEWLYEWSVISS